MGEKSLAAPGTRTRVNTVPGFSVGRSNDFIYLSLHCHHLNDSCIKMGSDDNHCNVSLTVTDKVTRQCPQTTTFEEKEADLNRGPSAYQPNAVPLGQPGSLKINRRS